MTGGLSSGFINGRLHVYSQNFLGYICNNWLDGWLLPEQTCYMWFKQHNVCLKKRCNGVNLA